MPVTAITTIGTLDEAIAIANTTEYGLTAGIFSEDAAEVDEFFERIEAGVTYANRRAGATTGAWPGVNPFGGWKCSGSSGKGSGGPYYVQQFLEGSRADVQGARQHWSPYWFHYLQRERFLFALRQRERRRDAAQPLQNLRICLLAVLDERQGGREITAGRKTA